ncbi:RloB family protein [Acrocarpospora catenulata]|uniref:RloB family protein n=1 Tax=Acrocarpospora catenulata TaxID=2836182 RepID=UPI001BD92E46|nr:RloB family protein [Acrocarpospora catenulata]
MAEGENTEPQYFRGLARELRATGVEIFRLSVEGIGRDPARVVRRAAAAMSEVAAGSEYDHVWCVVDVDDHETLGEALREAKRLAIRIAISNPCFELWILWHFLDHRAHIGKRALEEKLKRLGLVGKNLPANFPYENYLSAIKRGEVRASGDEYRVPDNPASTVYRLARLLASGAAG